MYYISSDCVSAMLWVFSQKFITFNRFSMYVLLLLSLIYLLQTILIRDCRNIIFLFFSWHACPPEFINISTVVISNLFFFPILAPYFLPCSLWLPFILNLCYRIFEHVIIGSVDLQFAQCSRHIFLYWRFDSETLYDFWYKTETLLLELQKFTPSIPHNY